MMTTVPDHFSVLRNYYSQLYNEKSLCDLSMVTNDGTTVLAHKLIVAAFCGAVRSEVEKWKDLPQISIAVDCDQRVLHCILDFMYTGKIQCQEELLPLLSQASIDLAIPALLNFLNKTFGSDQLETTRMRSDENSEQKDKILLSTNSQTVKSAEASTVTPIIKSEIEDPVTSISGSSIADNVSKRKGNGIKAAKSKETRNGQFLDVPVVYVKRKGMKIESSKEKPSRHTCEKGSGKAKTREKTLDGESINAKSREKSPRGITLEIAKPSKNDVDKYPTYETTNNHAVCNDNISKSQSTKSFDKKTSSIKKSQPSGAQMKKKSTRTRAKGRNNTAYDDDFFTWSEDDGGISDEVNNDDDLDKDYDPWNDRDDNSKISFTSSGRRSTRSSVGLKLNLTFKEPIVKLVRIDSKKDSNVVQSAKRMKQEKKRKRPDAFMYSQSQERQKIQNRYTREYMTKLAQGKDFKRAKSRAKLPKEFMRRMKHANPISCRKPLTVLAAEKIMKRLQEPYREITVNNTGYSCKTCRFWHSHLFQVRLHINKTHHARSGWPKKRGLKKKVPRWNPKNKPRWVRRKLARIKRKTNSLQCFKCNRTLKTLRTLAGHYTDVHRWSAKKTQQLTGYPKYFAYHEMVGSCQECGKKFTTLNDLRIHSRSVHKKKYADADIPCKVVSCSRKFHNVTKMRNHLMKFHNMADREVKTLTRNFHTGGIHVSKIKGRVQKQEEIRGRLMVERHNTADNDKAKTPSSWNKKLMTKAKTSTAKAKRDPNMCRRKCRFKAVTPKRKYVCNTCGIPTIFLNRMRLKTHSSVVHKRILIVKMFESRLVVKKRRQKNFPSVNDYSLSSSFGASERNLNGSEMQNTITSVNGQKVVVQKRDIPIEDLYSVGQHEQSVSSAVSCNTENFMLQQGGDKLGQSPGMRSQSESENRLKRQYTCQICTKGFRFYSIFSLHWQRKHSPKLKFGQKAVNTMVSKHVTMLKCQFLSKKPLRIITKFPKGNKLNCEVCGKLFANLRNLASHLQTGHDYTFDQAREVTGYPSIIKSANLPGSTAISCMNCPRNYQCLRSLSIHLQNFHKYTFEEAREATGYPAYKKDPGANVKTIHKCEKCTKTFSLRKEMRQHTIEVHGQTCIVCEEKFATIVSVRRHGIREHPEHIKLFQALKINSKSIWDNSDNEEKKETDYKCEKCDFSTRKLNLLTAHVMENHPEIQHNCPCCGYSFRTPFSVEKHLIKHHGEDAKKKVKCIFCDKRFLRLQFMRIHQLKVHGIPHRSLKEYACDFDSCKKVYYSQNEFNQHQKLVHFLPKLVQCNQCEFTTSARHKLLRHVRHVHLGLKAALCESCGKAFTTEQHMKVHYRRYHTNDFYNLQCEYCAFRCGARNELQTHVWHSHQVRLQDDTRQYWQCDQCPYSTPLRNKFINHMNGHNNVRNFMCDKCDARFVTSSTMREHIKWKHSSPDNVKICTQCGYKTKTNSRLNEHIRVQHQLKGIKPYKCVYCDFRSATNGNCRKHIMARHRDMPVKYEVDKEYLNAAKEARKDGNTNCLVAAEQIEVLPQQIQVATQEVQVIPQFISVENLASMSEQTIVEQIQLQ